MTQQIPQITLPSPELKMFVGQVREYMRDHAVLNRLIRGEETSDRQMAFAVIKAISQFNTRPPRSRYSLRQLLDEELFSLLMDLTVVAVIESVGLLQTRNHINYSAGAMNVGINDKTPLLMQWLQYYRASTDQEIQRVKTAMNIESILGPGNFGNFSEYWSLSNSYISW